MSGKSGCTLRRRLTWSVYWVWQDSPGSDVHVVLRLRAYPRPLDVAPLSAPPPVVNRAKTCACVGRDVL